MSTPVVDFLERLATDLPARRVFTRDPHRALASSGLTEQEQDVLTNGDVNAIRALLTDEPVHAPLTLITISLSFTAR